MNINIRELLGVKEEEKKERWLAEAVEQDGENEMEKSTDNQEDCEENAVEKCEEIIAEIEIQVRKDVEDDGNELPEENSRQNEYEQGKCCEKDIDNAKIIQQNTEKETEDAGQCKDEFSDEKNLRILSRKYGWVAGIAVSFVILIVLTFAYTSLVPRQVYATINGNEYSVVTKEYTIDEFLEGENIKYCEEDYISKPVSTYIYDGITFDLKHATDFKVTADGKTKSYKTLERTVGAALEDCGIKVGEQDIVTPGIDTPIGDDMEIVVQRVTTKQEKVKEKVPFDTVEKDDSSMNEGTSKVITEGVDGLDEVVYEIIYIDGEEASRKEVSRTNLVASVDKIVAKGTKINFNGKSFSRKLVVKAYAYTGGGRTAMGTKARVGEIAVDPGIIPLGSRVYIEGVGYRRAEDTGGNIKGNTIDIYMNTESECLRWGMRYVTIYIE